METIKLVTRGLRQSNEFNLTFFFFLQRLGTEVSGISEHKYNLDMYVCVYIYGLPGGSGGNVLSAMQGTWV